MRSIYKRLAGNALAKNKIVYVPYILSAVMMITISYVIFAITCDRVIAGISGGESLQMMMVFGIFVMYNISFFFLLSVSRFVIKQRKKELGLYSVLGMQKKHIIRVQFLENLAVYLISTAAGTIIGIVLTKIMQLCILKLYHAEADFGWDIEILPIVVNSLAFGAFFFVFFLVNAIGILRTNTLDYMKEQARGEKKPKSNWILAIAGVLLLSAGYYLSFRSQTAVEAFSFFFYAVTLVILGTLALFTAGSITLLNMLKHHKNYYYKTSHFISVSGMLYRMRRNAVTLATICIFATMVLVTLSSVVTLYATVRNLVNSQYPVDFNISYDKESPVKEKSERFEKLLAGAERVGMSVDQIMQYRDYNAFARIDDGVVLTYPNYYAVNTVEVFIMTLDTYNEATGTDVTLAPDEVGVYVLRGKEPAKEIAFQSVDANYKPKEEKSTSFKVVSLSKKPRISYGSSINLSDGIHFFVLPSEEALEAVKPYINEQVIKNGDSRDMILVNTSSDRTTQLNYYEELNKNQEAYGFWFADSRIDIMEEITGLYGGLFFLGIFLSVAFLTITILNMYFSQLLQGYEDSRRFSIMRKVGLTRKEIRKSINSQIVVVFLLPLVVAVIHTMASFPMVNRMLQLFGGCDSKLFIMVLGACIVVFAVVYTVAYFFTRRTYLKLVSGMNL